MLRYIDLFAGLGGFHLAMDRSNVESECVFSSELDKGLRELYKVNHGIECSGDIYEVDIEKDIPDFDLLLGGFPCQSFSRGGLEKGFDDDRGMLIFKIVEILNKRLPKYFILENVKNILHIDGGSCYETIMKMLGENYSVDSVVLSPLDIGKPYKRERVFFLGVRKDLEVDIRNFKFEKSNTGKTNIDSIIEYGYEDIPLIESAQVCTNFYEKLIDRVGGLDHSVFLHSYDNRHEYSTWCSDNLKELSNRFVEENRGLINSLVRENTSLLDCKRNYTFEHRSGNKINSLKDCVIQVRQSGVRVRNREYFPTVVRTSSQLPIIWDKVLNKYRYINSIELKRLHGLEGLSIYPKSKSKFTGSIGNSIDVDLVTELMNQFFHFL